MRNAWRCAVLSLFLLASAAVMAADAKPAEGGDVSVYVTKSGKKYHCKDCGDAKEATAAVKATEKKAEKKVKAEAKIPLQGELLRVDMAGKTISVRVENGMEQTFKFDDNTTVMGLEGQPLTGAWRR